jgi:sugar lactone lactonase YvrE
MPFLGSEDASFVGEGLVGKRGGELVAFEASGEASIWAPLPDVVYGLRAESGGGVVAALPDRGEVVRIAPDGVITPLMEGLERPNGIWIDSSGRVWVTEPTASRVVVAAGQGEVTVVMEGETVGEANGIVFDELRGRLFYSEYHQGELRSVGVDGDGKATEDPRLVADTQGWLGGIALDACGNIWAADPRGARVVLFPLNTEGSLRAPATSFVYVPTSITSVIIPPPTTLSWDPTSLLLVGPEGHVYHLPTA